MELWHGFGVMAGGWYLGNVMGSGVCWVLGEDGCASDVWGWDVLLCFLLGYHVLHEL